MYKWFLYYSCRWDKEEAVGSRIQWTEGSGIMECKTKNQGKSLIFNDRILDILQIQPVREARFFISKMLILLPSCLLNSCGKKKKQTQLKVGNVLVKKSLHFWYRCFAWDTTLNKNTLNLKIPNKFQFWIRSKVNDFIFKN